MFVFFNVSGGALIIKVHGKSRGEAFFLDGRARGRRKEHLRKRRPGLLQLNFVVEAHLNLFPRQVTFKESISVGRPSIRGRTVTEAAAWRDSQGIHTERQATVPPGLLSAGVCSQSAAPSITPRPPLAFHCQDGGSDSVC